MAKEPQGFIGVIFNEGGESFFFHEEFLRWVTVTYVQNGLDKKATYRRAVDEKYFGTNKGEMEANNRLLGLIEGVYWEDDERLGEYPRPAIKMLHGFLSKCIPKGQYPNRCRWN